MHDSNRGQRRVQPPGVGVLSTALVLLVPLAVTSTAGWRRRLGRRWIALHRLVYPIAILVCWHFWWQVKKDVTEPLVYAAILAALLGVRIWKARPGFSGRTARA